MKARKFEDDISSILIDNFKDHYVLVFELTSVQGFIESFFHPELSEEPLRLELILFSFEQVTQLFVSGKRLSSVAVGEFVVAGKII